MITKKMDNKNKNEKDHKIIKDRSDIRRDADFVMDEDDGFLHLFFKNSISNVFKKQISDENIQVGSRFICLTKIVLNQLDIRGKEE